MAPDFLSPDVVESEVQGNTGQIPQASTSSFAMVGYSPAGPEDKAVICTSFTQFVQTFGSFTKKSFNAYCAYAYFANGGTNLIFVRHLHTDATFASASFPNTWYVQALGRGTYANGATVTLSGNSSFFNAVSGNYTAFNLAISLIDPTSGVLLVSETYTALNLTDPTNSSYIQNVLQAESNDVSFTSVSGGGIPAQLQPVSQSNIVYSSSVSGQSIYSGSVSGAGLPVLPSSCSFSVSGQASAKDDGNGNIVAISGGAYSVSGTINYQTGAISVFFSPINSSGMPLTISYIQQPQSSVTITLAGGSDGSTVTSADLTAATLQPLKQGIYALDDITDEFAMDIPDFAGDPTTYQNMIAYAQGRGDVVVIGEPPQGMSPQNAISFRRNTLGSVSSYATMYYPWIKIPDPLNQNRPYLIPPSGHVAGRFAFTDVNANVGKAPAGVNRGQLSWIVGLERSLSKAERDLLDPAQINAIRSDSQVGTAIWGNNTLQIVGDFTDVNVRRLFIYLEKVQYAGLLDMVFEDVGPVTYGAIQTRLSNFLEGLWLNNVIGSGVTDKSQAFKVVCDLTNNPPAIQAQKIIVIDEFIKPDSAAKIIWLRLQKTLDASLT